MWARLKATIKRAKFRGKNQTIKLRKLKSQIKDRDSAIAKRDNEIDSLRKITEPIKIFNHVYPAQMVAIAVFTVVHAGGSLRCAAKVAEFYAKMIGWKSYGQPSPTTIRNWVIRCGYSALTYARDLKGDYVVIIDESIQIGKEKLLLMLGVKIEQDQCYCAPLNGADVQVLGIEVQQSWTSPYIARFIKDNLSRYPGLRLLHVVSDRGTSLLAAMRSLNLRWVSDCSHVMMNAVKEIFGQDTALSEISASIGHIRRRLMLTDWSSLLPPTLRDKDRFLRIFTIVQWADRMDDYWSKLSKEGRQHIAFYRKAWPLIRRMRQVRDLIVIASAILKTAGLSEHSFQRWKDAVAQYLDTQKVVTKQARAFISKIDTYFTSHAALYKGQNQLLCCSDIIESTFSRYKNKGGMKAISADVLSIALYNREINREFVREALERVSCQEVEEWQTKNVCHNRYGLRKRMDLELKSVG